jgi:hypothetical protein
MEGVDLFEPLSASDMENTTQSWNFRTADLFYPDQALDDLRPDPLRRAAEGAKVFCLKLMRGPGSDTFPRPAKIILVLAQVPDAGHFVRIGLWVCYLTDFSRRVGSGFGLREGCFRGAPVRTITIV